MQRPLWASTSTKNPALPDVYYVEALIAPNTVNTLPPATLDAFLDHGDAGRATIEDEVDQATEGLARLPGFGVDLGAVCEKLQVDGVNAFASAFDSLLGSLEKKIPVSGASFAGGREGGEERSPESFAGEACPEALFQAGICQAGLEGRCNR